MKKADAEREILRLFPRWTADEGIAAPTQRDAYNFYGYLQRKDPHVLTFRTSGDKGQFVKNFLLRNGLVI